MLRFTLFLVAACAAVVLPAAGSGVATEQWERKLVASGGGIEDAVFATRDAVWAVGAGGVFVSNDGGRSWQHRFADDLLLYHIDAAVDGRHGWAVGLNGSVAVTVDGGVTWTSQESGTDINLVSVAALDADSAVATGAGQGISDAIRLPLPHIAIRTDDGGATWRTFALPDAFEARRVDFLPDGRHGWISAERCSTQSALTGCFPLETALFRTGDGGGTWEQLDRQPDLYQFEFITPDVGWAISSTCTTTCTSSALRTTDGGATWDTLPSPSASGSGPGDVDAIDADVAIAAHQRCGEQACETAHFVTRDGGLTWALMAPPVPHPASHTAFHDASRAVRFPPLEWTDDGGATWTPVDFPVVAGSAAFDFADQDHGWFAAAELMRTVDGGDTWSSIAARQFSSLDFVSPMRGWATESSCAGLCEGTVFRTDDGGITWTKQLTLSDLPDTLALTFVDATAGWITYSTTSGMAIWHTSDGGVTWREQHPPDVNAYSGRQLAFVDRTVVWAVTSDCAPNVSPCSLLPHVSTDGGETWTPTGAIVDEEGCGPHGIAAIDTRHVWIAGLRCRNFSEPILHRSTDGGATWRSDDREFVGDSGSLAFFDSRIGRSFGAVCPDPPGSDCYGAIFRTNDGGTTWSEQPTDLLSSGYGGLRTQFVTPETIWHVNQEGGGVIAVLRHSLYLYNGGVPPIGAPGAGSGTDSDRAASPRIAVLVACGAVLALVAIVRTARSTLSM